MFHIKNTSCIACVALPRIWERRYGQPGNKQDPIEAPTLLFLSVFILTAILGGQVPRLGLESEGIVWLLPIDPSVHSLRESRSDLLCVAKAVRARLGFDLRFHSGCQVNIPLKELPAEGDRFAKIVHLRSESREMQSVCMKCSSFVGILGPTSTSILFVDGRLLSFLRWSEDSRLRAQALSEARLRVLSPQGWEVA
jgi:hypothetical protein